MEVYDTVIFIDRGARHVAAVASGRSFLAGRALSRAARSSFSSSSRHRQPRYACAHSLFGRSVQEGCRLAGFHQCLLFPCQAPLAGEAAAPEEWGEFLHMPGKRIYDFEEVEAEIIRETERATGRNKVCDAQHKKYLNSAAAAVAAAAAAAAAAVLPPRLMSPFPFLYLSPCLVRAYRTSQSASRFCRRTC